MNYGEELKARLKGIDMKQSELAERLGISRQAVSLWIRGKTIPHRAMRKKVEDILHEREEGRRNEEYRFIKGCPLCGSELSEHSRMIRNNICVSFWGYCEKCGASFDMVKQDERDIIEIWNRQEKDYGDSQCV